MAAPDMWSGSRSWFEERHEDRSKPQSLAEKTVSSCCDLSLMAGSQTAYSQDGGFTFGRTPTGSASEVVDSNSNGLGVTFRGGHMAGGTVVAKSPSLTST
jgi:hypothetical protein